MIMDFIYITLGMTTLIIFLFKRDWLLKKQYTTLILGWNSLLFGIGYILDHVNLVNSKFVVALKISLICHIVFFVLAGVFKIIYKQNPKDTFWTMDRSLMRDGVFNFLFWVIAGFGSAMLVFLRVI